jgi:hypothetical protein
VVFFLRNRMSATSAFSSVTLAPGKHNKALVCDTATMHSARPWHAGQRNNGEATNVPVGPTRSHKAPAMRLASRRVEVEAENVSAQPVTQGWFGGHGRSGFGTSPTSRDVRFLAAVGSITDISG